MTISDKDRCKKCSGAGFVNERKVLTVEVEKGMKHGQKITFSGEGDYEADCDPGDVVFVIQQKEHDHFVRKGDDLLMERHISLSEALTGASIVIKHLDEHPRHLHIKMKHGEIIKPGDVRIIADEGMPQHKNPFIKGKLFIRFVVDFPVPGSISDEGIQMLRRVLPPPEHIDVPMDAEECHMEVGPAMPGRCLY